MFSMNILQGVCDKKFVMAYPGIVKEAEQLQRYYELMKVCIESKPKNQRVKALEELTEFYKEEMSEIASKILDDDLVYKSSVSSEVLLTSGMRRAIYVYKNYLLRKGIIEIERGKPMCVVCGKMAHSGDLFVTMPNDNSAICLDCCTCDIKLNQETKLVFIS